MPPTQFDVTSVCLFYYQTSCGIMSSLSVQLSNHCIASCSLPPPFSLFPLPFPSDTVRCPAETATAAYLLSSVSEGELLNCVSIDKHVHAQIFWQQRGTKTVDKTIKRFFIFTCIQRKYHKQTLVIILTTQR